MSDIVEIDGNPVWYRDNGISVARIRCQAMAAKTGERCRRMAEWRQDTDGLVCQSHRFVRAEPEFAFQHDQSAE